MPYFLHSFTRWLTLDYWHFSHFKRCAINMGVHISLEELNSVLLYPRELPEVGSRDHMMILLRLFEKPLFYTVCQLLYCSPHPKQYKKGYNFSTSRQHLLKRWWWWWSVCMRVCVCVCVCVCVLFVHVTVVTLKARRAHHMPCRRHYR